MSTESLGDLRQDMLEQFEQLDDWLDNGVDLSFVHRGFQICALSLGMPYIGPELFSTLSKLIQKLKTIFLDARNCKDDNQYENALRDDALRALIYLTMELYGNG